MHAQRNVNAMKKQSILPISIALVIGSILALLLAAGCSNDLPLASVLERTRVLGARVEIASDPGRASVSPGEAATVAWIVAGPAAPASLDWAFALCTTAATGTTCKDAPQPIATGSGQPVVAPFTAPDAATLGTEFLPLMLGEVCADGTLGFDSNTQLGTCSGAGASGTSVNFVVPVTPDGATPNRHPVLANDVVQLGGVDWDPATATTAAAGDACDATTTGLPVVSATPAGKDAVKQEIRIVSDADDRETYTPAGATTSQIEELQVSNFTTAGKLDSSYTAIFSTDTRPDADVTVKWAPPAARDVSGGGEVVVFYFVVRDLRGGLDWTSRALCAVAP